jgi:hypothetical protein
MDKASKFPMDYPDIVLEQRADQLAQIIIDSMPTPPQETDFETGTNTFPVGFDTVTDFTYARTELAKIALSEPCHMYVKHGGTVGERLVIENAETRENATVKYIPIVSTESNIRLTEAGDTRVTQDGNVRITSDAEEFVSNNDAMRVDASYGDNVINDIRFRYIDREYQTISASDSFAKGCAFFSERSGPDTPNLLRITIPAGATKKFSFPWGIYDDSGFFTVSNNLFWAQRDANVKLKMGTPLPSAFFGFSMFDGPDELTDADISADLSLVSFSATMDELEFELTNNNAGYGYLRLSVDTPDGSSKIVVFPDKQVTVQDTGSIASEDYQPLSFDMVYQIDETDGTAFANDILGAEAFPRTRLDTLHYCANSSPHNMMAFMSLDIGDMFHAVDTNKGIDGYFFVQNMAFTLSPGNIINYSIGLVDNWSPPDMVEVSGSVGTDTGNGVSSIDWSHTVPAGDNRLLVVLIAAKGSKSVSSITFGAASLTKLNTAQSGVAEDDPKVEIWYKIAPAVSTATVTVNTTANSQLEAASINFINVDQSDPFGTFSSETGTGLEASVFATGGHFGDLFLDVISAYAALTAGTRQTERFSLTCDTAWHGSGSTKAGVDSTLMKWTLGASQNWTMAAVAVRSVS